ncbi:PTS sugar transporter subunit IIA [Mycoplasmopsis alligatoris]|uniref:PTS system fructose IIA component n=1 Tax=Mycoplasmopsis alligatoris A21JP2 TaxID=747682 RepID=D4XVV8_9BACT|nr:PTS fructose transporter subunit IIA [Mycoplasmopsis alligatoris]EFF41518.1 PTS system fructose IIA component [Mycoplasmopsis alligatoris A21JP2]
MPVELILIGHAQYPNGLKSVLEFVVGLEDNVYAYNIDENKEIDELKKELETHINNDKIKLIIADIPGGSPHQKAMELAINSDNENVMIFAGLGTSMIIDLAIKALLLNPSSYQALKESCQAVYENVASFSTFYKK